MFEFLRSRTLAALRKRMQDDLKVRTLGFDTGKVIVRVDSRFEKDGPKYLQRFLSRQKKEGLSE